MRLDDGQVEEWKFAGYHLGSCWVDAGSLGAVNLTERVVKNPGLLPVILASYVQLTDEESDQLWESWLREGTEELPEVELPADVVGLVFVELVQAMADTAQDQIYGGDRQKLLSRVLGSGSAMELLFVVVARNLSIESGGAVDVERALTRGVFAILSPQRLVPPLEPWEAIA